MQNRFFLDPNFQRANENRHVIFAWILRKNRHGQDPNAQNPTKSDVAEIQILKSKACVRQNIMRIKLNVTR